MIDYQHLAEGSYLHEFLFEKENRKHVRKERKKEQKKAVIYEPVLASRPAKAVIYEPVLVARPVVRFRRERPRGPSAAAFTMGAFERVPVFTLKTLSGARSQPRRGIEPAKNWQGIANFFEDHSANAKFASCMQLPQPRGDLRAGIGATTGPKSRHLKNSPPFFLFFFPWHLSP